MEQERLNGRFLIHLISCGLSGKKENMLWQDVSLQKVFEIAKKQRVVSLALAGLEETVIDDEELRKRFEHEDNAAIWLHSRQELERDLLYEAFESRGIRFMPLKGLVIKEIYPEGYARTMSDFDILVDEENVLEVKHMMEELGYTTKEFGLEHHDIYKKGKGICVEIHRDLMPDEGEHLYTGFDNAWDEKLTRQDEQNKMFYRQNIDEFYIFMIAHAAKHFFLSGFGMRLVLDIGVYRKKYKDELDKYYIDKRLKELKIGRFAKILELLADVWMNETTDFKAEGSLLYKGISETDLRDVEDMEKALLCSTVYGDSSQFRAVNADSKKVSSEKGLVINSAIRRIFPQKRFMTIDYPILKRHGWLLPVCWIMRIFKWVFSDKKKELGKEVSALKSVDYDNLEFKRRLREY